MNEFKINFKGARLETVAHCIKRKQVVKADSYDEAVLKLKEKYLIETIIED